MDFSQAGRGPRYSVDPAAERGPDPVQELARDWALIWRSEWAALAADAETALLLETLFASWLRAGNALELPASRGVAGADAPSRPAPAAAAADPRDAEIAALRDRLAQLERRLDRLDRRPRGPGGGG